MAMALAAIRASKPIHTHNRLQFAELHDAATPMQASAGIAATATRWHDWMNAEAPKITPSSTKASALTGWERTRIGIMPGCG